MKLVVNPGRKVRAKALSRDMAAGEEFETTEKEGRVLILTGHASRAPAGDPPDARRHAPPDKVKVPTLPPAPVRTVGPKRGGSTEFYGRRDMRATEGTDAGVAPAAADAGTAPATATAPMTTETSSAIAPIEPLSQD